MSTTTVILYMSLLLFQIIQHMVRPREVPHQWLRLCHSGQLHDFIHIDILCIICNTISRFVVPNVQVIVIVPAMQHMIRAVYVPYIQFFQQCAKLVHVTGSIIHHWKMSALGNLHLLNSYSIKSSYKVCDSESPSCNQQPRTRYCNSKFLSINWAIITV